MEIFSLILEVIREVKIPYISPILYILYSEREASIEDSTQASLWCGYRRIKQVNENICQS